MELVDRPLYLDRIGDPFSARRVADFMKSQRRSIRHETVLNYLTAHARRREYAPLEGIPDNYPKYVLRLDPLAGEKSDGIHHLRIPDFLLTNAY